MTNASLTPDIFLTVFTAFKSYVEAHYGEGEAAYFFHLSREKILPYFHPVKQFVVNEAGDLVIQADELDERFLLAFAAWLQQAMKEISREILGLPLPSIETLTESHKSTLEAVGFYEFFRQAGELEYD